MDKEELKKKQELEYQIIDVVRDELGLDDPSEYIYGKSVFVDQKTVINIVDNIISKLPKEEVVAEGEVKVFEYHTDIGNLIIGDDNTSKLVSLINGYSGKSIRLKLEVLEGDKK
jgi:hypothetical protein